MNVVLAGDGLLAAESYRALAALSGVAVVAAMAGDDGNLTAYADNDGVPVFTLSTLRHASVSVSLLRHLRADLLVLANVPFLVSTAVFDAATGGAVCFHPSLLPRHRGNDAVRQTLAAGDAETGVTIFRPDAGMDTGPALWQRRIAVPPGISAGGLYYRHLVPLGVSGIVDVVRALSAPYAELAAD